MHTKLFISVASAALLAALCSFSLASCVKEDAGLPAAEGLTIRLQVPTDGPRAPMTKLYSTIHDTTAASYLTVLNYESNVRSIRLFVFDEASGRLLTYRKVPASGSKSTTNLSPSQLSLSLGMVAPGPKAIRAVLNDTNAAFDGVTTLAQFNALKSGLSDNRIDGSGFVMSGALDGFVVPFNGAASTATIPVKRLAARIAVKEIKITSSASQTNHPRNCVDITLKSIFLSNVHGEVAYSGVANSGNSGVWYHKDGRVDEATRDASHKITDNVDSVSLFGLLWKYQNEVDLPITISDPLLFYAYPNNTTFERSAKPYFVDPFVAQKTRLVIFAHIYDSRSYKFDKDVYYSVALPPLEANKSYTLRITLKSLGSNDPNDPRGNEGVTVSFEDWGGSDPGGSGGHGGSGGSGDGDDDGDWGGLDM